MVEPHPPRASHRCNFSTCPEDRISKSVMLDTHQTALEVVVKTARLSVKNEPLLPPKDQEFGDFWCAY